MGGGGLLLRDRGTAGKRNKNKGAYLKWPCSSIAILCFSSPTWKVGGQGVPCHVTCELLHCHPLQACLTTNYSMFDNKLCLTFFPGVRLLDGKRQLGV